jgi:hypothetical protein
VIVGFIVAYPFNIWMVEKGLTHRLRTLRGLRSRSMRSVGMPRLGQQPTLTTMAARRPPSACSSMVCACPPI